MGPLTPCDADVTMLSKVALPPVTPTRRISSESLSSGSTVPGDFPWGGSSPSSPAGSIRRKSRGSTHTLTDRTLLYSDLNDSLQNVKDGKEKKKRTMPKPTRKVEGWGKPEILLEDALNGDSGEYCGRALWNSSDEEVEWSKSNPGSLRGTPRAKRADSPDLSALGFARKGMSIGAGADDWGSLLDEEMPEMFIGTAM
jgi:hypothetical protein